jgi:hypothetical protein
MLGKRNSAGNHHAILEVIQATLFRKSILRPRLRFSSGSATQRKTSYGREDDLRTPLSSLTIKTGQGAGLETPAGTLGSLKDAVATLRDALLVSGVLWFFIGYSYRYTYLSALGIPVHASQPAVNELFVYVYEVIGREWIGVGAFFLSMALILYLANAVSRALILSDKLRQRLSVSLTVLLCLLSLPIGDALARGAAGFDAAELRRGKFGDPAAIMLSEKQKTSWRKAEPLYISADGLIHGYVIDESDKMYYIAVQSTDQRGRPANGGRSLWIRREDVFSISQPMNCELTSKGGPRACP